MQIVVFSPSQRDVKALIAKITRVQLIEMTAQKGLLYQGIIMIKCLPFYRPCYSKLRRAMENYVA